MKMITLNQVENIVNADASILGIQKMVHSDEMVEKRR
jgi:hypothetical protein